MTTTKKMQTTKKHKHINYRDERITRREHTYIHSIYHNENKSNPKQNNILNI